MSQQNTEYLLTIAAIERVSTVTAAMMTIRVNLSKKKREECNQKWESRINKWISVWVHFFIKICCLLVPKNDRIFINHDMSLHIITILTLVCRFIFACISIYIWASSTLTWKICSHWGKEKKKIVNWNQLITDVTMFSFQSASVFFPFEDSSSHQPHWFQVANHRAIQLPTFLTIISLDNKMTDVV